LETKYKSNDNQGMQYQLSFDCSSFFISNSQLVYAKLV
jgi:hypothetical protein